MHRRLLSWFEPRPRVSAAAESRPSGMSSPDAQLRGRLAARRRRRGQRGVALIMVLGTLTVLTVMLTEFQDETSAELGSAMSARDSVRAEYAARSAVNLTRLLIAAEPTIRTAVAPLFLLMGGAPPQIPVWEYSDAVLGAFGDSEGSSAFQGITGLNLAEGRNLGMENAGFRIQVVDEDSKINLNLAAHPGSQQRIAEQILGLFGNDPMDPMFSKLDDQGDLADRATICSALIDWADPDEKLEACDPRAAEQASTGAEDGYYQLLPKPYQRKNAGFDSLEELHLVRGITDDLYDRFFVPDPDDPSRRNVTVWGQGPINVNTANPGTLLALICSGAVDETPLCTDLQQQLTFLSVLEMVKSMTPGVPVFNTKKAFVNAVKGKGMIGAMLVPMGFQPVTLLRDNVFEDAITVESKVFSIYATGYVRAGKKETRTRIHAVIDLRNAPPPGAAMQNQLDRALQGGQAPSSGTTQDTTTTGSQSPESLEALLKPTPGGTFLYYRVD
jgi:general secretion pathway protein K